MKTPMETKKINQNLEQGHQGENEKRKQIDPFFIQQSRFAQMGEMFESYGQEWQQPLNHLSLLIQDIREALEFGELSDRYIENFIYESMLQINHMSQAIHDFRKLYKPNKDKSPFSVADSIEDALAIFSPSLHQQKIMVNFVHRGQFMAFGYPNEFSQAVLNVLIRTKNAFIVKNSQTRILELNISETSQYIVAEISDNAGSIDRALMENAFGPCFSSTPKDMDFGLYVTKMILENMGGTVAADNSNLGTKYSLLVPKFHLSEKPFVFTE